MQININNLETREDYLKEAKKLKSVAFAKHKVADVRRTWDSFSRSSSPSKRDIKMQLQSDLQFLDELCRSEGFGTIFKEKEPVIQDLADE